MKWGIVLLVVVLGGIATTASAKKKKEEGLPKLFCNAQYVKVQTQEGDPTPSLAAEYPSDYNAAVGVENRIQHWGRYTVIDQPSLQPVDLVFVVWKERKTGNRLPGQPTEMPGGGPRRPGSGPGGPGQYPGGPGQYPGQPPQGPGEAPGIGGGPGDASGAPGPGVGIMFPVDDQMAVYVTQGDGSLGAVLWRHSEKDGLKEPNMPLFRKFADAVDDACSDSK
ncbi:MAG TPA: hypothetical protein VHE33_02920 [Acidobacteriaceae bacterium]|nr:hypothetical protein [Acidobacteriaceae bacterium]